LANLSDQKTLQDFYVKKNYRLPMRVGATRIWGGGSIIASIVFGVDPQHWKFIRWNEMG